jgi:serine/threonine protein kinase
MQTSNFLAKGSYGCVFYPSINACSGKIEDDIDSDHYITKIQSYFPNEQDEIIIGQKIQELPLYDHYFAPVVKSCKINTIKMDYNLVRSCAEMQNEFGELNTTTSYVSNKIRYVGKHHIFKYIQSLTTNIHLLYRKLINTHLHILDAVKMMVSEHIVHFDIKSQNIMYDEIQDVPIIIDFGISREITPLLAPNFSPLRSERLMRHIFVSYDTYDYWCIDIYILSNIGSKTILKPHSTVSEGHIKALLR